MRGTGVSYWNPRLHLSQMYTPLERCVSVQPGKIDPAIIAELHRLGYDQAPVLGGDHGVATSAQRAG